jgi:hypothetical protein
VAVQALTEQPPASRRALQLELKRRAYQAELDRRMRAQAPTLSAFIQRHNAGYTHPYWLQPLLDVYQAILDGTEVRVVVQAPPRHGKTDVTLNALAWLLVHDPRRQHVFATYADRLARSKSRKARRIARDAGVVLSDDSSSANQWLTTRGGGVLATGVMGPLTGEGVTGVAVVDDPIKNRQEAESRLIRDRLWDWWDDVLQTRLQPGSSVIVQATRWHDDDLSGRLVKQGDFDLINLPAIAEDPDDALGREPGEALWPEQYPVERLQAVEQRRPFTFASLYQQRPRPRGSQLFHQPSWYDPDDLAARARSGYRFIAGMDTAYAGRTRSDASVVIEALVWADPMLDSRPRVYVTRVMHTRARVPEFAQMIKGVRADVIRWRLYGAEHGTGDVIEDVTGKYLERDTQVIDKYAYAQPAALAWNDGTIMLPRRRDQRVEDLPDGVQQLVLEARAFTGDDDPEDDTVDALASMYREAVAHLPDDSAVRALTGQ